jgi:hypothetical protein
VIVAGGGGATPIAAVVEVTTWVITKDSYFVSLLCVWNAPAFLGLFGGYDECA